MTEGSGSHFLCLIGRPFFRLTIRELFSVYSSFAGCMSDAPSEGALEQLRRDVMDRRTLSFVMDDQLPPLLEHLRTLKASHLADERYLAARDVSELMAHCRSEIQYRGGQRAAGAVDRDAASTATGRQLSEHDRKLQRHDDRTRERLAVLARRHAEEREDFELEWGTVMPDRYRRPSRRLIEMRHATRSVAAAGQFGEAHARKAECEALVRAEAADAQARLNRDYAAARQRMLARHAEEVGNVQQAAQPRRDLLLSKRTAAEQAFANRLIVLDTKPNQNPRQPPPAAAAPPKGAAIRRRKRTSSVERLPPLVPPNEQNAHRTKESGRAAEGEDARENAAGRLNGLI
jgi:hypothetical protein